MRDFFKSRLFWIALIGSIVALLLPLKVSGYILGLLTVAYYFGVFSMAWDLLFGYAGEVNFGPTFLIGLGAYTAGIIDAKYGWPIYLCVATGTAAAADGRRNRSYGARRDQCGHPHQLLHRPRFHGPCRAAAVAAGALAVRAHSRS